MREEVLYAAATQVGRRADPRVGFTLPTLGEGLRAAAADRVGLHFVAFASPFLFIEKPRRGLLGNPRASGA